MKVFLTILIVILGFLLMPKILLLIDECYNTKSLPTEEKMDLEDQFKN